MPGLPLFKPAWTLIYPTVLSKSFHFLSLSFLIYEMEITLVKTNTVRSIILIINFGYELQRGDVLGEKTDCSYKEVSSAFLLSLSLQLEYHAPHTALLLHEVVREGCLWIQT